MEAGEPIDPYKKICKYEGCKKNFTAKRLNQDYCCPECKKKANNGKAGELNRIIKKINAQHKLNRKILESLFNAGKREISWEILRINKFDYSKPTGLNKPPESKKVIPEFYNYSLEELETNKFKITKLW